jgi:hypothetical protein
MCWRFLCKILTARSKKIFFYRYLPPLHSCASFYVSRTPLQNSTIYILCYSHEHLLVFSVNSKWAIWSIMHRLTINYIIIGLNIICTTCPVSTMFISVWICLYWFKTFSKSIKKLTCEGISFLLLVYNCSPSIKWESFQWACLKQMLTWINYYEVLPKLGKGIYAIASKGADDNHHIFCLTFTRSFRHCKSHIYSTI